MYTPTDSEAREWRRCSLLGLAVLLVSLTGEVIVSAHEERAETRKSTHWSCSVRAPTRSWSFLNFLFEPFFQ